MAAFGLNLESNGGNNHFMVRHIVGRVRHSGVKIRGAKLTLMRMKSIM